MLRPFGQVEQQTFPPLTNLRVPGQYFDSESGLHQNRFRDYDPSIGRYIESDPIGLEGGIDTYAYVGESPLNFADPYGLMQLPNDPSGLPPGWTRDPSHLDPNGQRFRDSGGNVLDFHRGRPGLPGWRGKNHWHYNNCDEHLLPGTEVPDPVYPLRNQPIPFLRLANPIGAFFTVLLWSSPAY